MAYTADALARLTQSWAEIPAGTTVRCLQHDTDGTSLVRPWSPTGPDAWVPTHLLDLDLADDLVAWVKR